VGVQVFTGQVPESYLRVDVPHTIRSVDFVKEAAGSRLRLTYRDKWRTGFGLTTFTATAVISVDGAAVPLLDTVFDAVSFGPIGASELFAVSAPFTVVGYLDGVTAGPHSFGSSYRITGDNAPIVAFVTGSPYLIEIDEVA
jgi:hypothetical protein